ncbi:MAG: hypothetical protein M1828_005050 [Chrysothrix sp. TS-e1954]|nr:MAG: hypothetical protein M1828_005050 [Chrysothrix sp. TS-e1954]
MGLFSKRKNNKPDQSANDGPPLPPPPPPQTAPNGTKTDERRLPPRSNSFFRRSSKASSSQASAAQLQALTHKVSIPVPPLPQEDPVGYLRSLNAVRERSSLVYSKALSNQLTHFKVDMGKFEETAAYVVSIIKRDYGSDYASIPPHGRWQHFEAGGVRRLDQMMREWSAEVDTKERTRRLLDLFLVSVLLDAGAGTTWRYKDEAGRIFARSEGLAIASLEMFKAGLFSSDDDQPCQVDAAGLADLNIDIIRDGLQVSNNNPIEGLEGRANILLKLSGALSDNQNFFGDNGRPGNMLVPMERLLNVRFAGMELLTGLPEYRNGGLLMDTGLLVLRSQDVRRGLDQFQENSRSEGQQSMEVVPLFTADDDVVVEWRAVTVGMLDRMLDEVNRQLGLSGEGRLSLAQMLEAGTWKGGREIAEVSRPNTRGPPIMIISDGTVF